MYAKCLPTLAEQFSDPMFGDVDDPVAVIADLDTPKGRALAENLCESRDIADAIASADVGDDLAFTHVLSRATVLNYMQSLTIRNRNLLDNLARQPPEGSRWVIVVGNDGFNLTACKV
jgi:hypothetical protein